MKANTTLSAISGAILVTSLAFILAAESEQRTSPSEIKVLPDIQKEFRENVRRILQVEEREGEITPEVQKEFLRLQRDLASRIPSLLQSFPHEVKVAALCGGRVFVGDTTEDAIEQARDACDDLIYGEYIVSGETFAFPGFPGTLGGWTPPRFFQDGSLPPLDGDEPQRNPKIKVKIGQREQEITVPGIWINATVTAGGAEKPKKPFVIDTGASETILDPADVKGLKAVGKVQAGGFGGVVPLSKFQVDRIVFTVTKGGKATNHECKPKQVGRNEIQNFSVLGMDCLDGLKIDTGKKDGTRKPSLEDPDP